MPSDVVMRDATDAELESVGELCVLSYSSSGHLDPEDEYAATLRDAGSRASHAELVVAERAGRLVGTVTICPAGSPFSEVGRENESEFRFLAVAPEAWRSGVGEAMVGYCEQRARQKGAVAQVISVIESNVGAQRFYRRLGFERLPERDWDPRPDVHLLAYRRVVPYDDISPGSR